MKTVWASQAKIFSFQWVFCESTLALRSDLPSSSGVSYDSVCDQAIQLFKNAYLLQMNDKNSETKIKDVQQNLGGL